MPHYDFEDTKTGEAVELFFSMNDAPHVGDVIEHEGRRLERVWSKPQAPAVEPDVQFKCWQVSGDEAAGAARYDSDGCPVFGSKREVRQFLRAQRERGNENATYGDGFRTVKP